MTIMPQRIISMMDAIMMTMVSFYMALSGIGGIVTILGVVTSFMAFLYWIGRLKMHVEKYHDGSVKKWLRYFIKKRKL